MGSLLLLGVGGVTAAAGANAPGDALSNVTGAWSASRNLLTAYAGDFVENISGAAATWYDQSGNARNFARAVAAARPTITTGGNNGRAVLAFNPPVDGTADSMDAAAISNFISNSTGYVAVSFIADAVAATNNAAIYLNDCIFGDSGSFIGAFLKNGNVVGYNWDGSEDTPTGHAVSTATAYVIEWWHSGGNLNTRLNAGTANTVASGNTSTMTGTLRVGNLASAGCDINVFEMVVCSSVPSLAERDALVADLLAWIG